MIAQSGAAERAVDGRAMHGFVGTELTICPAVAAARPGATGAATPARRRRAPGSAAGAIRAGVATSPKCALQRNWLESLSKVEARTIRTSEPTKHRTSRSRFSACPRPAGARRDRRVDLSPDLGPGPQDRGGERDGTVRWSLARRAHGLARESGGRLPARPRGALQRGATGAVGGLSRRLTWCVAGA